MARSSWQPKPDFPAIIFNESGSMGASGRIGKSMDIIMARAARDVEHKEILSRFREAVDADDQDRADSIVAELKKFNNTTYCECHAKFEDCGYQDCCR